MKKFSSKIIKTLIIITLSISVIFTLDGCVKDDSDGVSALRYDESKLIYSEKVGFTYKKTNGAYEIYFPLKAKLFSDSESLTVDVEGDGAKLVNRCTLTGEEAEEVRKAMRNPDKIGEYQSKYEAVSGFSSNSESVTYYKITGGSYLSENGISDKDLQLYIYSAGNEEDGESEFDEVKSKAQAEVNDIRINVAFTDGDGTVTHKKYILNADISETTAIIDVYSE